ncbi:MAG: leucine--tRNA ligase [Bacteroidetes bacterium]|nr:leucine--tRNA ligase [Bacteroidota bacterium]MBX7238526.1 leucine--tRNA ligase [Bacteroidia bacterium]MCC7513833.1 leucine--tRNA ligase [Bacteroidia bacterium]MCW5920117.1 leucine--tRNA ligase [Bacteroidota bacterium]HMU76491.1 leucine--tRNA ligase [Bacteroidia bacterium]
MDYQFRETEKKWQQYWAANKTFKVENKSDKPKFYVLDMFPYPSGAGLHVGHPLGYIASDIYSRFKRLNGFNVLHPMGYDSFGLPAEQYAIQTGQHPAITTEANINRYREQLDKMGFSFDWDREVRTSDPAYYKWTQWIFLKLFNAWYNNKRNCAESIDTLISEFEKNGNNDIRAVHDEIENFTAAQWKSFDEAEKSRILMAYRLAYLGEAYVNWCPALGTVLANDEVKDGLSERGGHPVERKLMKQWSMRITAYAERLLQGLEDIDWSDSLKEAQRNWIGKSEGTTIKFSLQDSAEFIEVFTTRPDTLFGVSFVTLAPEHELVDKITSSSQRAEVQDYVTKTKNRSERERQAEVTRISGVFTGSYVIHPFTGNKIPVWIGDYVLAGYGTGAVMAVPAHDERDFRFATHFGLERPQVIEPHITHNFANASWDNKEGILINSDFLNGLDVKTAISQCITEIEKQNLGKGKTNYRLRDAVFGRQRYWGEPIPIYYKENIPVAIPENELPLVLPEVDKFLPTETGEPPLARAKNWKYKNQFPLETTTMPGWAGSSWYFLRYMDAINSTSFASKDALNYWTNVDLYIGGSEHATGHLLYVRFWTKALKDLGYINIDEPAQKLINQGMIQGTSCMVHRDVAGNKIISAGLKSNYNTTLIHIDVNLVDNTEVDIEGLNKWRDDFATAEYVTENGKLICETAVEKMSKRWYNVVTPDSICEKYGADCLRMYEMFLGPLEQSKPWNTNGIAGVSNFIRKLWKLYHNNGKFEVSNEAATKAELKTLHKTIKKVQEDVEKFSFNTSVSTFMICVNELTEHKCNKREVLEPLAIILSPYAPHIAEELWHLLGHNTSVSFATFPEWNETYLIENEFDYPVSVNGKTRFKILLPLNIGKEEIERHVMASDEMQKWTNGNAPKKVIVVPGRIVNVVI